MSSDEAPQLEKRPQHLPNAEEKSLWHVIQQGAQVIGEGGGGIYGIAKTGEMVKNWIGGNPDSGGRPPSHQQPSSTPSQDL
jgi:hypothetical protein